MLMPAEVIRRAERFKSSIAMAPQPPATCMRHGVLIPSTSQTQGGTRHLWQRPWQALTLCEELLKDKNKGVSAGIGRRAWFSQQFLLHMRPLALTTTASALRPSTWPPKTCTLPRAVLAGKALPRPWLSPPSGGTAIWDIKCCKSSVCNC